MNGLIALLGSGEYLPVMDDVDRYLLANCGADWTKTARGLLADCGGTGRRKEYFPLVKYGT